MSETNVTPFATRAEILADLWLNYRNDQDFQDFIEYNDIGLPLAYAIANSIVVTTDLSTKFINETFELFLAGMEIEDTGYETLDDVLGSVED